MWLQGRGRELTDFPQGLGRGLVLRALKDLLLDRVKAGRSEMLGLDSLAATQRLNYLCSSAGCCSSAGPGCLLSGAPISPPQLS